METTQVTCNGGGTGNSLQLLSHLYPPIHYPKTPTATVILVATTPPLPAQDHDTVPL